MSSIDLLQLLLSLSVALNIAFVAGIIARADGMSVWRSIFVGAGAAGGALGIYFAAMASFQ